MNKRALDVDDVLAAFTPHAFTHHGKELRKLHYWDIPTMNKELGEGWFNKLIPNIVFWESLPLLSKPEDITFEFDYYLSSMHESLYDVRVEWLKKHGFPNKPLVVSDNKVLSCLELGIDVLIDDKPQTIKQLSTTHIKGIHFITHYAGFEPVGPHIVTNLNQVQQLLLD